MEVLGQSDRIGSVLGLLQLEIVCLQAQRRPQEIADVNVVIDK
jgi:hypothetical protein